MQSHKSELVLLQQMVASLCRLILRHEDALALQALDTRFVLFCSNHEQGLPGKLWKVAKRWREKKEKQQVNMSLRVTMGMYIVGEVIKRAEECLANSKEEMIQNLWLTALLELSTLGCRSKDSQDRPQQGSASSSSGPQGPPSPGGASPSTEGGAPPALASSPDGDLRGLCDSLRHGHRAPSRCGSGGIHPAEISQPVCHYPAGLIQRSPGQVSAVRFGGPHSSNRSRSYPRVEASQRFATHQTCAMLILFSVHGCGAVGHLPILTCRSLYRIDRLFVFCFRPRLQYACPTSGAGLTSHVLGRNLMLSSHNFWVQPCVSHMLKFTGRRDFKRLQVSTLPLLRALLFCVCPLPLRLMIFKV